MQILLGHRQASSERALSVKYSKSHQMSQSIFTRLSLGYNLIHPKIWTFFFEDQKSLPDERVRMAWTWFFLCMQPQKQINPKNLSSGPPNVICICPLIDNWLNKYSTPFPGDSVVKNPPTNEFDPWVGKIPWKRKWQPTPTLAWKIPWTEEPGGLQYMGSQGIGHDLLTNHTHVHWKTRPLLYWYEQSPRYIFSSVQFSHLVVSNSLWPRESQHSRSPCPSQTPGAYPNSCPSSWWCHPAISSSVVPFSFCPQSLPASGSIPMSQLFTWGGQSIGVSASASVLQWTTRTDLL